MNTKNATHRYIYYFLIYTCVGCLMFGCATARTTKTTHPVLLFKDADNEERANYLLKQLRTNPNDVESRVELAKLYLVESFISAAIKELKRVETLAPHNIRAILFLAYAYQKYPIPDYKRAVELLERASRLEPNKGFTHLELAQAYVGLNNDDRAIDEFKKAVSLSKDPAILLAAHLGLMAIYQKRGDAKGVEKEFNAAQDIYPSIDDMIKWYVINRITPPPEYDGDPFGKSRTHPELEDRIKKTKEEIKKIEGGK